MMPESGSRSDALELVAVISRLIVGPETTWLLNSSNTPTTSSLPVLETLAGISFRRLVGQLTKARLLASAWVISKLDDTTVLVPSLKLIS